MAWSQSIFLQALGWATLNSFWQLGLLWCAYQVTCYYGKPGSNRKYQMAVYGLLAGTAWFGYTFFSYYLNGQAAQSHWSLPSFGDQSVLPAILSAASITYLALLFLPAINVYRNWRYLQQIRYTGLQKAPVRYRSFVQKIAGHVGIRKSVQVYLSNIVTSPVTIGYLKPIILIPVAALNNLTVAQLEAVLLHELSHIRRYDYLVNLLVTAINVFLYFNPFVRLFIRAIEGERENCCDELVLQFEYDKMSYASALLELEKTNHKTAALAMSATHRNNLLSRIERIVGIQKKPRINAQHLLGAFAAFMLLLTLNSLIISTRSHLKGEQPFAGALQPYSFLADNGEYLPESTPVSQDLAAPMIASTTTATTPDSPIADAAPDCPAPSPEAAEAPAEAPSYQFVAFDEADATLSAEEKQEVKTTIGNARKMLQSQWLEVAKNIPDGMTRAELEIARQQYMAQVDQFNWQGMEQSLKSNHEEIDLEKLNKQLTREIALAKIDSVQSVYEQALAQIDRINLNKGRIAASPLPDGSVSDIKKVRADLERKIAELRELRNRNVIKL
ncbi:M56 family metallopeptidase [Flaviaesturariibacter amylovorans]|uniref:Peptidase M56 domain-containing protein n=1 Tax=Flaviaesturariibacter amylovorans TaxID=1084520 RepID=A0ABP8GWY6_9BACT